MQNQSNQDAAAGSTLQACTPAVFCNDTFGKIRVIEVNDAPYFSGIDVAKALGYANPRDALGRHCVAKGVVKHDTLSTYSTRSGKVAEQTVNTPFISEGNVYRLISRSKLKTATEFESWVFDDILPTIRKTGGYVNNAEQFVKNYFPNTATDAQAQLIQMLSVIKKQDEIIGAQQPSVEFTRAVTKAGNNITVGDFAKILNKQGLVDIGRNRLFSWLRENGYMMPGDRVPYQKYITSGLFAVQETVYNGRYCDHISTQTLITPKGQQVLAAKVRASFMK